MSPGRRHPNKDLRAVIEEAQRKGWRVDDAGQYWKLFCPRECKCFKPSSARHPVRTT